MSRDLFKKLMHDEEEHIDCLETQLDLISKLGIQNYLQSGMTSGQCHQVVSGVSVSSTRRFCWRPSGVSFEATGCVLP